MICKRVLQRHTFCVDAQCVDQMADQVDVFQQRFPCVHGYELTAMSANELLLNASVTRTFSMRMLSLPASLLGLTKINSVTCYQSRHRSLASLVTQGGCGNFTAGKPPLMQGTDAYMPKSSCTKPKTVRVNGHSLGRAQHSFALASKA